MKKVFTIMFLMMLVVLTSRTFALDTLTVFAKGPTLDAVINGDVDAAGLQKHAYKLVSLDTTYIFDATITVKGDLTVVGVLGPNVSGPGTGRPPCIQPDVLGDGSIPAVLFTINGSNTKATFKNLYLMGLSLNGSPTPTTLGVGIQVSADNVKTYVDNCVFEEWRAFAIGYNGNNDGFWITNNRFRNTVDPTQQYEGEVIRCEWPGTGPTDTLIMKYNTIFCINCYSAAPVTKALTKYFEFSHNSVIYSFKNPFFTFNVTTAKFNNNIFYSPWAGGISRTEMPWWDQLWSAEVGSIIDFDTLDLAKDSVFNPGDYGKTNFRLLSEQKRNIEVKNNLCFWPANVVSFWKTWNDTATVDSIYTPTWMNTRTTGMFADKTTWPGLVESGNVFVDPGYGASILDVLTNTSGLNGVGFFNYFRTMRSGLAGGTIWGYHDQTISGSNWIPNWPLPEATDMVFTNAAVKTGATDGTAIGDHWFLNGVTGVKDANNLVPSQFKLYDAYPNPFNPSTIIKFNLAQSGNVVLRIYNVMGQLVKTVINNEYRTAGEFSYSVKMDELSSGVYFYSLTQGDLSFTKKMVLLK